MQLLPSCSLDKVLDANLNGDLGATARAHPGSLGVSKADNPI